MSVRIVPNKKATQAAGSPVFAVKSTNGTFFRVQGQSTAMVELANAPGVYVTQNRVGFAWFQSEDMALKAIEALSGSGRIVYIDSTEPLVEEQPNYGLQYPYPMRYNGLATTLEQRVLVQEQAARMGMTLKTAVPDSDGVVTLKAIYRRKLITTNPDVKDVILPVMNREEVESFVASILSVGVDKNAARKQVLQAIIADENSTKKAVKDAEKELATL